MSLVVVVVVGVSCYSSCYGFSVFDIRLKSEQREREHFSVYDGIRRDEEHNVYDTSTIFIRIGENERETLCALCMSTDKYCVCVCVSECKYASVGSLK